MEISVRDAEQGERHVQEGYMDKRPFPLVPYHVHRPRRILMQICAAIILVSICWGFLEKCKYEVAFAS